MLNDEQITTTLGDFGSYSFEQKGPLDKTRQTIIVHDDNYVISISDPLYGYFDFVGEQQQNGDFSKLLHTLLFKSSAIKRLDKIHQAGAFYLWNTQKYNVTRLEHSIGVMLLIRKLSPKDYKQQLAGLLHDISHTAFSHVADIIFENNKEDFHETIFENIINASNDRFIGYYSDNVSICNILRQFDMQDVIENLKLDKYTLLEKDFPMLCADRIDYTLRDTHCYKLLDQYTSEEDFERMIACLKRIVINDGQEIISFKHEDLSHAELFMKIYKVLVVDFFLGLPNLYFNDLFGDLLKECIKYNIITIDDMMYGDDLHCLSKILVTTTTHSQAMNAKIIEIVNIIKHRSQIIDSQNESLIEKDVIENYVEIVIDSEMTSNYNPKRKKRVIDFKIQLDNGELKFISEYSELAKIMCNEMNVQDLPSMKRINLN